MSKKTRERHKKVSELNGVLGELNLSLTDTLFISDVLNKMVYEYNRQQTSLTLFQGPGGNMLPVESSFVKEIAFKFFKLSRHLRAQERMRLGIGTSEEKQTTIEAPV